MGKFSNNLNKKFRMKNQEKSQSKLNDKYFNQAYRPDVEVKLTGEQFMYLRKLMQDVRGDRVIRVIDAGGVTVGQGLSPRDFDVENVFAYVEQLHRKNVDAGVTVPIDVLRKELEGQQNQFKNEEQMSAAEPEVSEELPVTSQNTDALAPEKKVTIKEKVGE